MDREINWNMSKMCLKCGKTLPITKFYVSAQGYFASNCKDCDRLRKRELYSKKKDGAVRSYSRAVEDGKVFFKEKVVKEEEKVRPQGYDDYWKSVYVGKKYSFGSGYTVEGVYKHGSLLRNKHGIPAFYSYHDLFCNEVLNMKIECIEDSL